MDAKELDTTIRALQNGLAKKHPETEIIDILERLKKDVNATEELLRVGWLAGAVMGEADIIF